MKLIVLILCTAAIFQTLTAGVLSRSYMLNFSIAQFCIFPLMLLLLWKLKIARRRVPRGVIVVSALGALVGLSYGYTYAFFRSTEVLIARFQDDPIEARTRRFRELLNQELRHARGLHVGRFHGSLTAHSQIRSATGKGPKMQVLLWGNSGWIQLSLVEDFFEEQQPLASPIWSDVLPEFKLVNYAPAFGLTIKPEAATVRFLTTVLQALHAGQTTSVPLTPQVREIRASFLKSAAGMQSTWSSYAHRSYPLFLLGNQYLREAFREGHQDLGELECGLRAYAGAEKYLRNGDNPELRAAVLNNTAIALLAQSVLHPTGKSQKLARAYLRSAMRMSEIPSKFGAVNIAPNIAAQNWQVILEGSPGRSKKWRRHKKKKRQKRRRMRSGGSQLVNGDSATFIATEKAGKRKKQKRQRKKRLPSPQ